VQRIILDHNLETEEISLVIEGITVPSQFKLDQVSQWLKTLPRDCYIQERITFGKFKGKTTKEMIEICRNLKQDENQK